MDQQKKRKIIILTIIILVLLGILLWVWRLGREPESPPAPPAEQQPVFQVPSADLEFRPITEAPLNNTEFTIINLAKTFAARFGSWSTDNQGYNLLELEPLSTSRMKNYLRNIPREDSDAFLGVSTKSLAAEIISLESNRAEVLVGTQRVETGDDLRESVYYQDIRVMVLNSGEVWLVDEIKWLDKK